LKNQYTLFSLLFLFFFSISIQGKETGQLLAVVDINKTTAQEKASKSIKKKQRKAKKQINRLKRFLKRQKTKRTLLAMSTIGLFAFFRKKKKWGRNVDQEGTLWLKILIGIILFGGVILMMPWLLSIAGINVSYWVGILIGVGFAGLIAFSVFRNE